MNAEAARHPATGVMPSKPMHRGGGSIRLKKRRGDGCSAVLGNDSCKADFKASHGTEHHEAKGTVERISRATAAACNLLLNACQIHLLSLSSSSQQLDDGNFLEPRQIPQKRLGECV